MLTTAVLFGLIAFALGVAWGRGRSRPPPAAGPPLEELAWAYRSPAHRPPAPSPPAKAARRYGCGGACRLCLPVPLHTTEADMAAWREDLRRHPF